MKASRNRVRVVVCALVAMAAVLLGVGEASAASTKLIVPASRTDPVGLVGPAFVVQVSAASSSGTLVTSPKVAGLRLRASDGTSGRIKGLLYKGDHFKITGQHSKWLKVRLTERSASGLSKGTTGWVYKSYVYKPANCPSSSFVCKYW